MSKYVRLNFLPIALFATLLLGSSLPAATGTLRLSVRDVQTDHPISTTVQLDGPESVALQTDQAGNATRALTSGEYRVLVSAPGYNLRKAQLTIGFSETLNFHIMLDAVEPPEEERPEAIDKEIRPGFTYFHGYVVDDESGLPLPQVKVRFVNSSVETYTDLKGHYGLSVPTPSPVASDEPGTDTMIYEKSGYKTVVFENTPIWGEALGGNAAGMEKGAGRVIHDDIPQKGGTGVGEPQGASSSGTSQSGSPVRLVAFGKPSFLFHVRVQKHSCPILPRDGVPSGGWSSTLEL